MKLFLRKIICFFKFGWWAFKNDEVLGEKMFNMMGSLLELILKVAIENKHYMTHICYIHPELNEQSLVSIWAGAGVGADPLKRIEELINENVLLQQHIKQLLDARDKL